jgi:UDP-glucose 4-epimerase
MKTVVVGGAGFIGSNLCESLLRKDNCVICIDNLSNGSRENIKEISSNENFIFYDGDAADIEILDKIFSKEKPDIVFHLAANSDIQASASNPRVEYRNTYTTTFCILESMRNYGIKKIFFASTSAVYGDKHGIELSEDASNLSPISYYGAAKLGSEALIQAYSYMNDLKTLIFRFPNVIGPKLTHGVIYDFIRKLDKDKEVLNILGDGKQTKPYIYVSDLVEAIIDFTVNAKAGVEIYNLGVSGTTSVKKIADILCMELGLEHIKYEFTGGESGWKGDVPQFRYCLDKIHKAGWMAQYTSDEAVRKTIRDIVRERKTDVR